MCGSSSTTSNRTEFPLSTCSWCVTCRPSRSFDRKSTARAKRVHSSTADAQHRPTNPTLHRLTEESAVTTTLQPPVRPAPAGRAMPHKVLAKAGLYVFLLANAAFVTYLFNAAGVGSNMLVNFGRLAGLYGALAMAFQLLLVARLPWLDRRIGMDKLTSWHRWVGFTIFWMLVGHLTFIAFGNAGDDGPIAEIIRQATELEGILRALVAWTIIMVVGV